MVGGPLGGPHLAEMLNKRVGLFRFELIERLDPNAPGWTIAQRSEWVCANSDEVNRRAQGSYNAWIKGKAGFSVAGDPQTVYDDDCMFGYRLYGPGNTFISETTESLGVYRKVRRLRQWPAHQPVVVATRTSRCQDCAKFRDCATGLAEARHAIPANPNGYTCWRPGGACGPDHVTIHVTDGLTPQDIQGIPGLAEDFEGQVAFRNAEIIDAAFKAASISCSKCSYPDHAGYFATILGDYIRWTQVLHRIRVQEYRNEQCGHDVGMRETKRLQAESHVETNRAILKPMWPCEECIARYNPTGRLNQGPKNAPVMKGILDD